MPESSFCNVCVICNIRALDSRVVNNMRVSGGSLHLITITGN